MRLAIFIISFQYAVCFSMTGCGIDKGCWFQPPECETRDIKQCKSSVKWTILPDSILFEIEGTVNDLDPTGAYWLAVGFSKDMHMGDDSVVECTSNGNNSGKMYVSFNDETSNSQLLQASEVMLKDELVSLEDGRMKCSAKWLFDGKMLVDDADTFKIFDLDSREWHILFARGVADRRSLQKYIHSVDDGDQFPWTSVQTVRFCRHNNCSIENNLVIKEMKQTDLSRYWRYRFAVIHGTFLLLAWWILGSSAILIARYFKPLWPREKLLGTAVWFQLHRDSALISLIFQIVAIFLIIFQAGRLYQCSYECTSDDWAKKMHVITGIAATSLALLQPFLALARPGPSSHRRPIFNWIHWFVGMTAWTFAATAIILSVPLGKTGLQRIYGHAPTWIMASYIIVFLLCNIILEIISSTSERRTDKIGSSEMALGIINGPSTESPIARPLFVNVRLTIFLIHLIVAVAVSITITVMLMKILLSHSP